MAESFPTQPRFELPAQEPVSARKTFLKFALFTLAILCLILGGLFAYKFTLSRTTSYTAQKRVMMGTVVEITAYGTNAEDAVNAALDSMERVALLLDANNPKSEVSLINRMAGIASVAVSHDTFDVIYKSVKISNSLYGSFDISIGALTDLWSINQPNFIPPDHSQVKEALKFVNSGLIEADPEVETVKLPKRGMKLNLGGVGKGYVVSVGRNILILRGITSALISTGSSISCIGTRPDKTSWRVGVRSPREEGKLLGVVLLSPGQALSTSGDYEQYKEIDGKRYSHIIDPKTGYPVHTCQAVTILSSNATLADMLSTAVFVLGPSKGMQLIKALDGVEGLIIDANGVAHRSDGFVLEEDSAKER